MFVCVVDCLWGRKKSVYNHGREYVSEAKKQKIDSELHAVSETVLTASFHKYLHFWNI